MKKGKILLLPTYIGNTKEKDLLPTYLLNAINRTNIFVVENIRNTRRFIKSLFPEKDIESILFLAYGKHNKIDLDHNFLQYLLKGDDIGIISDSGTPCIADPGSNIVRFAHKYNIQVIPFVGPSSILLALMSSGLNGQNFAFLGYLPIDKAERKMSIKKYEKIMKQTGQTQIFIETPYRNNKLLKSIINNCNNNTYLSIASNITSSNEFIKTQKIAEWKNQKIDLHKIPTIFLIG